MAAFAVGRVPAARTFPLRQQVLRPHQGIEEMALEGDDDPDTAHFAVSQAGTNEVVSTGSVRREAPPPELATAVEVVTTVEAETAVELARAVEVVPPAPAPAPAPDARLPRRSADSWRLRGMATREDLRGTGLGTLVLEACIDHVGSRGGGLLWCSARTPARRFYEDAGFVGCGEEYEVDRIGPHVHMWRLVGASRWSSLESRDGQA